MYKIKEIYYTIQGEGGQSGRPAVFVRFSGCNLWSGREQDRANAICQFCDTDFFGMDGENGGKYDAAELIKAIGRLWGLQNGVKPFVVFTGGEPALQLDDKLIAALHSAGIESAVETNGTLNLPEGIDWVCVSPKANTEIVVKGGNELKIVYPQEGIAPVDFEHMDFDHFFVQPMDGPRLEENTRLAIEFCKTHPRWRLSVQSHKYLNIP